MSDLSGVLENFDKIMQVIYFLAVAIAGLKFERHVTVQEADRVINWLDGLAQKTKTKLDDMLVSAARFLNGLRRQTLPSSVELTDTD